MNFDQPLKAILLRQRGQNHRVAEEIQQKISPEGKERLFRILQDLEQEIATEMRKRFSGVPR